MNQNQPPVSIVLTELGIPHTVFRHAAQLKSLEQAADERDQRPEQVVRSILFRVAKGDYVMVLMPGPRQIDWKTLRKYLGTNRVSMASTDEVLSITGYQLGANSYIRKPLDFQEFIEVAGHLGLYWLLVNEPRPAEAAPQT